MREGDEFRRALAVREPGPGCANGAASKGNRSSYPPANESGCLVHTWKISTVAKRVFEDAVENVPFNWNSFGSSTMELGRSLACSPKPTSGQPRRLAARLRTRWSDLATSRVERAKVVESSEVERLDIRRTQT